MTLRRLALLLVSLGAILLAARGSQAQLAVATVLRGSLVTVTATCCGGMARRGDEVCSTTRASAGQVVVRRGRVNRGQAVATVQTDAAGQFQVALPPGTYCVVGPEKSGGGGRQQAAHASANVDSDCMAQYLRTCDAIATVPGPRVVVRVDRGCFGPCYRGPMPP